MDELIRLQSDICRTFANPYRLQVIKMLCEEELNASEIIEKIGISKANLSQHMSLLISRGLVVSRKTGKYVYYKLADERIAKACKIMSEVVIENLKKSEKILKKAKS